MSSFERCVVLLVDDEPSVLRTVSYVLERHGYQIIPAIDGPSALRVCAQREGPIHLALLDVMMPGMSGPELFERLRGVHPHLLALFMSGYQAAHLAQYAPVIRAAHFIEKPFLPRTLVQRVNEILGNTDVCILLEDEKANGA